MSCRKWNCGDVHPVTGLTFLEYGKSYKNGEYWVTEEKYISRMEKKREINTRSREKLRDKINARARDKYHDTNA